MAEEVKIEKQIFHDRLSHFISAWKADKRANDALFGGAGSIVILMGKNEETITFQKNNAMHVGWRLLRLLDEAIVTGSLIVLVTGLRVPCNPILNYYRTSLHSNDC